MGCMQIMPATWRYLTARHALGRDPWNARLNMIGGALYLAELARRFGFPGAYAAYNAGPARYARHLSGGRALPAETVAYMVSLSGGALPQSSWRRDGRKLTATPPRWQEAGLFLDAARPSAPASETAAPSISGEMFPLSRRARDHDNDAGGGEK